MVIVKLDDNRREIYQQAFMQEVLGIIRIALEDGHLNKDQVAQLSNDIAFGIGAYFDGGGDYTLVKGGDEFRPILAFRRKEESNTLYYCSGGILHELVGE